MPTLNIKDPEAYRLASELADKRGTSMTAAVRDALAEALARRDVEAEARKARLRDLTRRAAQVAQPEVVTIRSDHDLYDETGLPR
ncbi:type II toxin-antitoxin system VapB family antitoxin [Nocardioides rubriscoriae]|uniref:type II toxin-antitoxin system VapB family antitoxin n=1 Tax=Nocardioides rubriscoriae TaxID=642762 RepID=UPI0014788B43|nr:type II toxin-antitoxin system VapB family antitoxin [Nocardioides rubriscoriae]